MRNYNNMKPDMDIDSLKEILVKLWAEGKILAAILFGSYAKGTQHIRSDLDLAVYINAKSEDERIDIIDDILMSEQQEINILRLDDDEESPFIVQEALKGLHLVEPDSDDLYKVAIRTLHEAEGIRFRRSMA